MLPTLYKKTSTGAIETWRIWADGDRVYTEHGQLGGKMQTTDGTRVFGKNTGRANATTAEEQAESEARSKWEQKAKKGYVLTVAEAEAGTVNVDYVTGGVLPMLANNYQKRQHKVTFPCAVQPKLDGHRCIAVVNADGTVSLWSRSRKPITGVPHVAKAIEALGLSPGVILDGELYNHDYRDNFEDLTSFIRQQTPKPGHEVVQYHVYDLIDLAASFAERYSFLLDVFETTVGDSSPLVLVTTELAHDAEEVTELFARFVSYGYEGAIVRNLDGFYVGKRTDDLLKVKEFEDAEFEVLRVEQGRGKMEGRALFVCGSSGGEFRCKMVGKLEHLEKYVRDPSLAVGRLLTVQYQSLTGDGIPRFPIGLRFREDA